MPGQTFRKLLFRSSPRLMYCIRMYSVDKVVNTIWLFLTNLVIVKRIYSFVLIINNVNRENVKCSGVTDNVGI